MILRNPSFRRDFLFTACLFLFCPFSFSAYSQGVIGTVHENVSNLPVENATVHILHGDSVIVSINTASDGTYKYFTDEAIRVKLSITALSHQPFISEEIVLDGYSTFRLESKVELKSYELEPVTVVSNSQKNEPYLYRITRDQLNTIAGNFDDPVRVAVSAPGIVQINDQANHISVRGQNPLFNTWYLEGLEIVNPNHTNNAGTFSDQPTQSGGGINMFSAQTLDRTDVYTGINPLTIGRTAGAVIDMHLHESAKAEYRAKAGLIGLELGGGTSFGAKGMLDVNLRYSFTGLLAQLGVDFGGETISFGDAVASFRHQGAKHKFKIFAWAGESKNEFNHVETTEEIERYKDLFDIDFRSSAYGVGLKHEQALSSKLSLHIGGSLSSASSTYDRSGQPIDSVPPVNLDEDVRIISTLAELLYQASPKWIFTGGIGYTNKTYFNGLPIISPYDDESFLRPYVNAQFALSRLLTLEIGGDMKYTFAYQSDAGNNYFGYRANLQWRKNENMIYAGLRHSAGQNIKTIATFESYRLPLLIDKFEFGWNFTATKNAFQVKTFFQQIKNMTIFFTPYGIIHLSDIPDVIPTSYSGGNNKGKANYYGIEADWAYSADNGFKFNINQTVYESKHTSGDDEFTDGRFSGGYISHLSVSKEIIRVKKEKNRIWNFSLRGILQGGLWEPTIDLNSSEQMQTTIYTNTNDFNVQLPVYKRVDVGISRTIANAKIRWRYSLDIQNLFGFTNIAYHYFDPFLQRIESQKQLGIIPVLSVQASW